MKDKDKSLGVDILFNFSKKKVIPLNTFLCLFCKTFKTKVINTFILSLLPYNIKVQIIKI